MDADEKQSPSFINLSRSKMANTTNTTNSTEKYTCWYMDCIFTDVERYSIVVFLFVAVVASLVGNVALLTSVLSHRQKRRRSSLATINLAVADLLITLFCAPAFIIDMYITEKWISGSVGWFLCKFISFVQNVAVVASLLNLAVISGEKFLAVCLPFGFYLRSKLVKFLSPVAWLMAIGEAAYFLKFKAVKEFQGYHYCQADGLTPSLVVAQACLFFVPLFLIVTFQAVTIHRLKTSNRKFGGENVETEQMTTTRRNRERKAINILIVTMATFVVCWTPLNIFSLLNAFGKEPKGIKNGHVTYAVCMGLFFFNATTHPLVYWCMTEKGRRRLSVAMATVSLRVSSASLRVLKRKRSEKERERDLRQVAAESLL